MEDKISDNFISLHEASKATGYHSDYLGFLCRTGKLKGFKIGRNWVTTKADLDTFLSSFKNGISEVTDDTGKKIAVHVSPNTKEQVSEAVETQIPETLPPVVPTPVSAVHENNSVIEPATVSEVTVVVADPGESKPFLSFSLDHLKKNVLEGLEQKVEQLNASVSEIENKIHEHSEEVKSLQTPSIVPVAAIEKNTTEEFSAVTVPGKELRDAFSPTLAIGSAEPVTRQRQLIPAVLDANKVKKLLGSFTYKPAFNKAAVALASVIAIAGFAGSVAWSMLVNRGTNDVTAGTTVVYQNTTPQKLPVPDSASGNNQTVILRDKVVSETVTKVLGQDQATLYALIDQRLNQYLAEGKFKGEKGDQGIQGATGLQGGSVGYVPSGPVTGGGTVTSATYFSSDYITANNVTIQNSLTDNGTATFNGAVTFNNNVNLTGTTTISHLAVTNINPGFSRGSVVFQGVSGLTEDSANFFYSASTSQLSIGTSTPDGSALVQLESTSKGFLAPRMTLAQRDAISNPAAGLMVFNTDTKQYNVYNGAGWGAVGGGGTGGVATGTPGAFPYYAATEATLTPQSTLFFNNNKIGLGTSAPAALLHVASGSTTIPTLLVQAAPAQTADIFTIASSNGSSLLSVLPNGRVGIGVSNPETVLELGGDNPQSGILATFGNNFTGGSSTGAQIKLTQTGLADWVFGQPANENAFAIWTGRYPGNDGTEVFRITSGGNVGIGTTTPGQALTVAGSALFTATSTASSFNATNLNSILQANGQTVLKVAGDGSYDYNLALGPQAGASLTSGLSNTLIGSETGHDITNGSNNTYVGLDAGYNSTSGSRNVLMGVGAGNFIQAGSDNVYVGYNSGLQNNGNYNVLIGGSYDPVSTQAYSSSIGLGYKALPTASNQFVVGSNDANGSITDVYFGQGVNAVSPAGFTLNATGGSGANNAGGSLTIAGGKGTGTASGGNISFQTSNATTSGATLQTLSTKAILLANGNFGIGTSTPGQMLTVAGTSLFTGAMTLQNGLTVAGVASLSTTTITGNLTVTGSTILNGLTYNWPASQAANYYLKTDGSGNLTWAPTTGGGAASSTGAVGNIQIAGSTGNLDADSLFTYDKTLHHLAIGTTSTSSVINLAMDTSSTGGINFGDATANLYRSAAGTIQTDGTFSFLNNGSSRLTINGNTIQSTASNPLSIVGGVNNMAGSSNEITLSHSTITTGPAAGADKSIVTVAGIFQPTSGTGGSWSAININNTINQATLSVTGITRGLYINPTVTKALDYRALETAAYTATTNQTSLLNNILFNQPTYATTGAATLANAQNLSIGGAPIAGPNMTISSSSAFTIQGGAVNGGGTVTNAYGLYLNAPSGATNNYAAAFMGGNVGIGTSGPSSTLTVVGTSAAGALPNVLTVQGAASSNSSGSQGISLIAGQSNSGRTAAQLTLGGSDFNGGNVTLYAGTPNNNANPGYVDIQGGTGWNLNGGNVYISGGAKTNAGAGNIVLGLTPSGVLQGYVAIGTSSPAGVLTVHYDASSTASTALYTVASTTPVLQLGQKPIASQSANGTYFGLNSPSGFSGNYFDIQRNSSSVFKLDSFGGLTLGGTSSQIFNAGNTLTVDSNGGTVSVGSGVSGAKLSVGTGSNVLLRLGNTTPAATSTDVQLQLLANRTTGGLTNIGSIQGIITNIGNATYSGDLAFLTANAAAPAERMRLTSTGNLGIGTSTPGQSLVVAGNMQLTGALFDSTNASGTSGMILQTTGTGTQWVATSTLGFASASSLVGTAGQVPYFTSSSALSSSAKLLFDGNNFGFNATSSTIGFNIQGTAGTNTIFNVASSSGTSILAVLPNSTVGIGTTTTSGLLTLQGNSNSQNILNITSSTGSSLLYVTQFGGVVQNISSSTAFNIQDGSGNTVFNIDTTQGSANSGIDISAGAGQTGNLLNLLSSGGTPLAYFSPNGGFVQNISSTSALSILNGSGASVFNINTASKLIGINTTTGTSILSLQGSGSSDLLDIASSTGASVFHITSAGNVGIGTTTPVAALSFASSTVASGGINLGDATANLYRYKAGGIKTDGDLLVGGNAFASTWALNNSVSNGGIGGALGDGLSVKLYSGATGNILFQISGTEAGRFSSNGYFGLGTTTPSSKLQVVGDIQIGSTATTTTYGAIFNNGATANTVKIIASSTSASYTLALPTAQGAANTLLLNDGSGNLSFVGTSTLGFLSSSSISGTNGQIPYFASSNTLNSSAKLLFDGNNFGFNATSSTIGFNIQGTAGTNTIFNVASSSGTSILAVLPNSTVGIGTTTTSGLLTLQGNSTQQNLFNITSSTGTSLLNVSWYGGLTQNISSTTAVNIQDGNGNSVFNIDTTQSTSNAGIEITAGPSQTGDLLDFYTSGRTLLAGVSAYGGIFQNIASTSAFALQNGSGANVLNVDTVNRTLGLNTSSLSSLLGVQSVGQTVDLFDLASTSGASLFRVTQAGNVGIGTTTPTALFTVNAPSTYDQNSNMFALQYNGVSKVYADGNGLLSALAMSAGRFLDANGQFDLNDTYHGLALGGTGTGRFVSWTNSNGYNGTIDLGITRNTAGMLEINNGTVGQWRDLVLRNLSANTTSTSSVITIQGTSTQPTMPLLTVASSTGSSLFTVSANGNVGINTSTASALLGVVSNVNSGDIVSIQKTAGSIGGQYLLNFKDSNGSTMGGFNTSGQLVFGTAARPSIDSSNFQTYQAYNFKLSNNTNIGFTGNQDGAVGTMDVGIARAQDGILRITDGTATNTNGSLIVGNFLAVGTTSTSSTLTLQGSGAFNPFTITSSTGSSLLTVLANGNVGIGTSTPTTPLYVYQSTAATDAATFSVNCSGCNNGINIYNRSNNVLTGSSINFQTLASNGVLGNFATITGRRTNANLGGELLFYTINSGGSVIERTRIDANGNFGVGTSSPSARLSVTGTSAIDPFDVSSTSGSSILRVTQAGNVGIGTTTPGQSLVVVGSTTITSLATSGIVKSDSTGSLYNALIAGSDIQNATIDLTSKVTGVLPVANGGTGTSTTPTAQGQLLADDGTHKYAPTTLIAGSNVTITTTTPGQITIAATSGGGTGSITTSTTASIGKVAIWTGLSTLGNGLLMDNGTVAGINATSSSYTFNLQGSSGVNPLNVSSSTGTSLFMVAQNGNVGIGTTTPGATLTLQGTSGQTANLLSLAVSGGAQVLQVGNTGNLTLQPTVNSSTAFVVNNSSGNSVFSIDNTTPLATDYLLTVASSSGANLFTVNGLGTGYFSNQLGIGTTSPIGMLNVHYDASSTASSTLYTASTTNAGILHLGQNLLTSGSVNGTYFGINSPSTFSGNFFDIQKNGTSEFKITSAGALTAAGAITGQSLGGLNVTQSSANSTFHIRGNSNTLIGAVVDVVENSASHHQQTSGTSQLFLLAPSTFPFDPTSGSGNYNNFEIQGLSINQTGTASGVTRGQLINPTLTSTYDYRILETATATNTLSNNTPAQTQYNVLFNPFTYQTASTTAYTIATSSTLTIAGAPIASTTSLALTNSFGLLIQGNNVTASTTNAYGALINAPSGATNNYAAAFMGGNVGIGTSTPGGALTIQGIVGTANPFTIASSTGTSMVYVSPVGHLKFQALNTAGLPSSASDGAPGIYITNGAMTISGNGNTGSSGSNASFNQDGSISLQSQNNLTFTAINGTSPKAIIFKQGLSESARFDTTGFLGIGTATPSSRLQVVGDIAVGSAGTTTHFGLLLYNGSNAFTTKLISSSTQASNLTFTLPATAGSAGQTLLTDGSGGLYFGAASASLSGGTSGYMTRWLTSTTVGTGIMLDNGSVAGINATSSNFTFNLQGGAGVNPFNVSSSTGTSLFTVLADGTVGIGTTTTSGLLTLQGNSTQQNLFNITSSTGASLLNVSWYGGLTQNISSTTAVNIQDGSGNSVFAVDTTQQSTNAGLDITAGGSQTGNLLNFYSSGGTLMTSISAYGGLVSNVASTTAILLQNGSGSNVLVADTLNRRLGLNTTTVSTILDVYSMNQTTDVLNIASTSGASFLRVTNAGNIGINTTTPIAQLALTGVVGTNPLVIASSTGAQLLNIQQSGNVGIGNTTTPTALLTVQGTAGSVTDLLNVASSTNNSIFKVLAGNAVQLGMDASSTTASAVVGSAKPVLQLGSTALSSPSANGTYLGVNSLSNFTGNFVDLQNGGTSVFKVLSTGSMTFNSTQVVFDNTAGSGTSGFNFQIPAAATNGFNISSGQNLTRNNGSTVNIFSVQQNIGPTSGASPFNAIVAGPVINQTSSASGITRGLYVSPTLTKAADFRALEVASGISYNVAAGYAGGTVYGALFNPYTITSSTAGTIANAQTVSISGGQIAGGNITISSSTALTIQGASVTNTGSVTNAYSLFVQAPTGASNNYAAVFTGGNVGVGTTTPGSAFVVAANCAGITGNPGTCTDYAELYPSAEDVSAADLVTTVANASSTNIVAKTAHAYDSHILGVVSSHPAMVIEGNSVQFMNGANYTVDPRRPAIALAGRIPVKVASSTVIHAGDYITSSNIPGVAMKAERSGYVLGQALEDYDPSINTSTVPTVMVFSNPGYQIINNTFVLGESDGQLATATSTPNLMQNASSTPLAFLINQKGSGDILQLQSDGQNRFLINNNGSVNILADMATTATSTLLSVQNGTSTVFSITAAGDLKTTGHIMVGKDTAGTVVVPTGATEVTVTFAVPYTSIPKIVVTVNGMPDFFYGVTSKTETSFTVTMSKPATTDTFFDWVALEQPDNSLQSQSTVTIPVSQSGTQGMVLGGSTPKTDLSGGATPTNDIPVGTHVTAGTSSSDTAPVDTTATDTPTDTAVPIDATSTNP